MPARFNSWRRKSRCGKPTTTRTSCSTSSRPWTGPLCAKRRPPSASPRCRRRSTTRAPFPRRSLSSLPRRASPSVARRSRTDDEFLRALHRVLFDVHVLEGRLVCKESGQVFPIEEGRANMMISEELA
mmetsp:Transcript_644/g.1899  ORF Transcript_644/g.1899 Transcript_644/m.1899 type:complete len:128 (+) Transcript_644:63-446(+)